MAALGIFDLARRQYFHLHCIVIKLNDIPVEKTIPDDAVYFDAINAGENFVIVDVKIQTVHIKSGQVQSGIIQEFYIPDAPDTADRFVRRFKRDLEFNASSRIKGNAAAAGVQNEIETVGIIINGCFYQHNPATQGSKRNSGYFPGRWLRKLFLRLCGN